MTKSLSSGNSWVGSNRGITNSYWLNTDIDAVQIWSVTNGAKGSFSSYSSAGTYGAGQLQKNVSEVENGKQVIEFKDKEGKVILKKVQLTAPSDIGLGSAHSDTFLDK